jgi:hypothetical protein
METITDRFDVDAGVSWNDYDPSMASSPETFISAGTDKVSYSLIRKQKLRQVASPFGFGLKSGDFSFHQKSILAALLFSRKSPKQRMIGM